MAETPAEIIAHELEWRYGHTGEIDGAQAIIARLAAKGWKIMPREPTEAMLKAAYEDLLDRTPRIGHYRAMWDAAP